MQQRRPSPDGPLAPRGRPTSPRPTGRGSSPSDPMDLLATLAQHRARQQHDERAVDALFRDIARRSLTAAPPTLTSAVRESVARTSIAPTPQQTPPSTHFTLRFVSTVSTPSRVLARYQDLGERQRRIAQRGVGTLVVALLCGLGFALDPGEWFSALGLASAVVLSFLAVVHVLSTAFGALMSSTFVAVIILALYSCLALLWIRLVRRPLEA